MRILLGMAIGIVLGALAVTAWVVYMPIRASHQFPSVAARTGEHTDVELGLTDEYLTREMQQEVQGVDLPIEISNLRIGTEEGNRVIARFVASAYGQHVDASMVLTARVADGSLRMEVVETNIGNLPLPASIIGQSMETRINQRVSELISDSSYRVVSARTTAGSLVVGVQQAT